MAKYKQGIDGPVLGKIGQHVGSKWKGIYYLRSLAAAIANPRTVDQRKIRSRFAALSKLGSTLMGAIKMGFYKVAKNMSEFDLFISKNFAYVTANNTGETVIDYGSLSIADGPVVGVNFGAVDYGETQHLNISAAFTGNLDIEGADSNDDVYLVAYCPELDMAVTSAPVKRSQAAVTVAVPSLWDGQEVYVYGFVRAGSSNTRYDYLQCSRSVYCGSDEVQ